VQFSAAEIAHQLASAEECNKLIVKKAVLDAGLQEYDTFVRSLFIVILIFTLFHLIIFCIISLLQLILDNQLNLESLIYRIVLFMILPKLKRLLEITIF
jgi:uncharacterized membrane protein